MGQLERSETYDAKLNCGTYSNSYICLSGGTSEFAYAGASVFGPADGGRIIELGPVEQCVDLYDPSG